MWWTGCTRRLQKHILGFWVTVMAAARRCWLFFLDSHPRHVTKGQVVFSASSTAASPGCRCVCNPAGTATPVLIKTVEGTRRTAVVQSGALFSWRQPDFPPLFFFATSHIIPVCCHIVVWEHGAIVKCGLFFYSRQSAREQSLCTLPASTPLVHDSPLPLRQVSGSISAALSPTAAERCVVRPCTVQWRKRFSAGTLCILKTQSVVIFSERAAGVRAC